MKILVLSDLHLGRRKFNPEHQGGRIDDQSDVVVLAGDVDDGTKGLRWAREAFPDKPVVYVAGNHEFYDGHWTAHVDAMRKAAREHDIEFLEADTVDLGGVRFLGCSLWTDFELFGPHKKAMAQHRARLDMSDYGYIKVSRTAEFHWLSSTRLVPELTALRHGASVEWLEKALAGRDPKKTVVVTHHAPHPMSIPTRRATDALSPAYASDLSRLMGRASLWIHGHVHDSVDYTLDGTRVVCNPRGYVDPDGGPENSRFDPGLIVEL
jgi:predicted phosphodiesterase